MEFHPPFSFQVSHKEFETPREAPMKEAPTEDSSSEFVTDKKEPPAIKPTEAVGRCRPRFSTAGSGPDKKKLKRSGRCSQTGSIGGFKG